MLKNLRFLFIFLIGCFIFSPGELMAKSKFVPPEGKVLLIVGQDKVVFDDYVNAIGIVPAGFTVYTSVQNADGLESPVDYGGGVGYAQYLVDKYPNTVVQIGLWVVDALDDIVAGCYDENIDKLGEWMKKTNRPVYLRIGYEFDFPENRYEPEKYVKAYKYIVDRFRKNGVDNIAYVWHSYASAPRKPIIDWYPGDDYVDWCAVSYFNQGQLYMNRMVEFAQEHKKPVMIAESTPYGIGIKKGEKSWKSWFVNFFNYIEKKNIKAVCYIDCDWETLPMFAGKGWGDARVQANEFIKAKWLEEIKKPKYLQSSPKLYKLLEFKPR